MGPEFNSEVFPGGRFYYNRLFHDYIFNPEHLKGFFHYDYHSMADHEKRIGFIKSHYDTGMRKKASNILEEINRGLEAGQETMKNIRALSEDRTVVVIGGQQPGLFTGPIFIIYKIITVLKLSRFIQEKTGTRVIPCFWNASDDSSLGQSDSLGITGSKYYEIKLDTSGTEQNTRLSHISFPAGRFTGILKEMDSLLPGAGLGKDAGPFLEEVIGDLSSSGKGDGEIGLTALFSHIILRLFSRWGIVVIDPLNTELKKMGLSLLSWDLRAHQEINRSIAERGNRLEKAGYHAQLAPNRDVLDFFINRGNVRKKVRVLSRSVYEMDGKRYTESELLEIAGKDPLSVSWNVVLRPLLQDTVLPVAATVCGPGEVSYFAQLGGVYSLRGIDMPVIYPRFSATIVDKKTDRLIDRTGLDKKILALGKQDAEKIILKKGQAAGMEEAIGGLDRDIGVIINKTEDGIREVGIDPGSSFDRIRRNLSNEVKVLIKKLYSALKKQNQFLLGSIGKIYEVLFPEGYLQERKANIFYYISQYGMQIIDTLYEAYDPQRKGHIFIYLEEKQRDE